MVSILAPQFTQGTIAPKHENIMSRIENCISKQVEKNVKI